MFKSLKQKIAKETGQNVEDLAFNNNNNSRHSSLITSQSVSLDDNTAVIEDVSYKFKCMTNSKINSFITQREAEINMLRNNLLIAQNRIKSLEQEKLNLEESLKICQIQKDLIADETDKIQNFQHQEINKLKNLLLFREQVRGKI